MGNDEHGEERPPVPENPYESSDTGAGDEQSSRPPGIGDEESASAAQYTDWEPSRDWEVPEAAGDDDTPPRRGRGRSVLGVVLVVILAVGMLVAVAAGTKLHNDKKQMTAALDDTLRLMEFAASDETVKRELTAARRSLEAGRYGEVKATMDRLQLAGGPGGGKPGLLPDGAAPGPGEGKLPPEAYADLPTDAVPYFKKREELFKQFLEECNYSRQLRDSGVDVEDLRGVRDSIIEAARLGQDDGPGGFSEGAP